jgi:hypothetical protein
MNIKPHNFANIATVSEYPNDIYVIHNLINDSFCENMIKTIDNTKLNHCEHSYNNNVEMYVTTINNIIKNDNNNTVFNRQVSLFLSGYVRAIAYIINEINPNVFESKIPKISEVEMRKIYGPTRLHTDSININECRLLTCIIALNGDYGDGILSFPKQDVNIKLNKGDIIVFPPYWTHPHGVSCPSINHRYTMSFWFLHETNPSGLYIS